MQKEDDVALRAMDRGRGLIGRVREMECNSLFQACM